MYKTGLKKIGKNPKSVHTHTHAKKGYKYVRNPIDIIVPK